MFFLKKQVIFFFTVVFGPVIYNDYCLLTLQPFSYFLHFPFNFRFKFKVKGLLLWNIE